MNGQRDYKVKGQIGLEPGFRPYLARLVDVFREVQRVLKPTGVLWINMGDSWVNDGRSGNQGESGDRADRRHTQGRLVPQLKDLGLKPKSLVGQPWRLAIALQELSDLLLRQECIWQKPTATPDSARDRPSRSHETVFMFTKQAQYFYDGFAVMEPCTGGGLTLAAAATSSPAGLTRANGIKHNLGGRTPDVFSMRNQRSVWRIQARPFGDEYCTACSTLFSAKEKKALQRTEDGDLICTCGLSDAWVAHFATFPSELARRCIAAGSSEHGCCGSCGSPYERIVKRAKGRGSDQHPDPELKRAGVKRMMKSGASEASPAGDRRVTKMASLRELTDDFRRANSFQREGKRHDVALPAPEHMRWAATCSCADQIHMFEPRQVVPAMVLDPFAGAGTTLLVAEQLGRDSIGIELNADYCKMAEARIRRELLHAKTAGTCGRASARSAS